MDNVTYDKFDLCIEKKILPIICDESPGTNLRNLRVKSNLSMDELCNKISISNTTLRHIELDKIKVPYYYWKLICQHFNINHIDYLKLYNMKEKNYKDQLLKIRAYLGAKTWKGVGDYLGYSESFINDMLTRYTAQEKHIKEIECALEKLK